MLEAAGGEDLVHLGRPALARMSAAADEVLECERVLAKTGDNVVAELLRGAGGLFEWDHYPKGDVYDADTHAQYFYHAHPQDQRTAEHGHFHTFLRPRGMPAGIKPAPVPDGVESPGDDDSLSHLIAISMDKRGRVLRLFTTNRWVTGETWYAAPDVIRMLDCFAIDHARPSWPANRWITAVLRLFRPQIVTLIAERDTTIAAWQASHADCDNVYEDRRLEVTSFLDASVPAQTDAVRAALASL